MFFRGSNDSGIHSLVSSTLLQSSHTQSVFANLFVYAGQTFCDCSVSVCMGIIHRLLFVHVV